MTSVRVVFVLIFAVVQLCTADYVKKGWKMILKDNLSLNLNRCHHPFITAHCEGHQVVQISISWRTQFECSKTDVIEGLIVNAKSVVSIFNQLVN